MKKLVFLFAMVLAVSFAMAQKTTTLIQSGDYNDANVLQNGLLSTNTIDVTQSGLGNDLIASQTGLMNYLISLQSGDHNEITSTQTGGYNDVDAVQSGFKNKLDVDQLGLDNYVMVNQAVGGTKNYAEVDQRTYDDGVIGGKNTADVYQKGDNNDVILTQMEEPGSANDGWFIVTIPENDRSINVATAVQSGDKNDYQLKQGRQTDVPDNTSALTQSGDHNTATVDQTGYKNYSTIAQSGDKNDAGLMQVGHDAYVFGYGDRYDESYSSQTGEKNTLSVKQTGEVEWQYAESKQNGDKNKTTILQVGYTTQNVDAYQKGTADIVDIDQVDVEP